VSDHTFSPRWLALREGVDHGARPSELLGPLQATWRARRWSRVLDLGSGTGSNLRYLAPRLPGPQFWTLVDRDPVLLDAVELPSPGLSPPLEVETAVGDLSREGLALVARADLVTASALLDLVSESWLRALVERSAASKAGVLIALSYDGSVAWSPPADPDDDRIRRAVNTHQRRDKGTGPALGPTAPHRARTLFQEAGFRTWLLPSPWRLGPEERGLALALVQGWAEVAQEESPGQSLRIRRWRERRWKALETGGTRLTVGHLDLLALPPGTDDPG
jgi:SAM-dependent methyltransferase